MKLTLALMVLMAAMASSFLAGCGKSQPAAPPQQATATSLPAYRNAKGQLICPVTGNVIESVAKAAGYQDWHGTRYYFCCSMCPPKFKADPEKFAVRHETEPM